MIARPIATRGCRPPESSRGRRDRKSLKPSIGATSCTRVAISSFGVLWTRRLEPRFSRTVMCGNCASFGKTIARSRSPGARRVTSRPSITMRPEEICSRPPIERNSVVLPQPDAVLVDPVVDDNLCQGAEQRGSVARKRCHTH